jgi:hypothetical protein
MGSLDLYIFVYICLLLVEVFCEASDCHTCYSKQRHEYFIILPLLISTKQHTKIRLSQELDIQVIGKMTGLSARTLIFPSQRHSTYAPYT